MSDEILRLLRENDARLGITEVKEVPGAIPGFTSFYAQGTYSPTYLGGTTAGATTYTLQQGAWTRIGNVVIVTGTVIWTAATGTGNAQVSLPLTSVNVANQNYSGGLRTINVTFANSTPQIQIVPNTNFFIMLSPLTNAASTNVAMEAAGNIIFTVMYFVA